MRYECVYNPDLNIIEATTEGLADMATMLEMVQHLTEICERERSANILVDHSKLDASSVTMDNVETLSLTVVSSKDCFKGRKCAHVVSRGLQFGLVRAWEALIEVNGFTELETSTFTDRDEAIKWIAGS
jgi:hypothetical protein